MNDEGHEFIVSRKSLSQDAAHVTLVLSLLTTICLYSTGHWIGGSFALWLSVAIALWKHD